MIFLSGRRSCLFSLYTELGIAIFLSFRIFVSNATLKVRTSAKEPWQKVSLIHGYLSIITNQISRLIKITVDNWRFLGGRSNRLLYMFFYACALLGIQSCCQILWEIYFSAFDSACIKYEVKKPIRCSSCLAAVSFFFGKRVLRTGFLQRSEIDRPSTKKSKRQIGTEKPDKCRSIFLYGAYVFNVLTAML